MKWYQLGSQVLGAFLFYLLAILTFLDISCLVNMSSDVMSYASQSGHAIYRGSRGIGLEKNLRCSSVFEQNLQF